MFIWIFSAIWFFVVLRSTVFHTKNRQGNVEYFQHICFVGTCRLFKTLFIDIGHCSVLKKTLWDVCLVIPGTLVFKFWQYLYTYINRGMTCCNTDMYMLLAFYDINPDAASEARLITVNFICSASWRIHVSIPMIWVQFWGKLFFQLSFLMNTVWEHMCNGHGSSFAANFSQKMIMVELQNLLWW